MIEDYAIRMRTGRAFLIGRDNKGKKDYEYRETYKTHAGEFTPQEWRKKVHSAIEQAGEIDLLNSIKDYCREHCAWLHKEAEIEDYAMDIMASLSYLHWKDFIPLIPPSKKNRYMIFEFEQE